MLSCSESQQKHLSIYHFDSKSTSILSSVNKRKLYVKGACCVKKLLRNEEYIVVLDFLHNKMMSSLTPIPF